MTKPGLAKTGSLDFETRRRADSLRIAPAWRTAAIFVPLCLVFGCKSHEQAPAPVVTVQAATVVRQPIAAHITGDAVLFPIAQAAIAPKVTAPVHKLFVQRGSRVKAGQLLAQLEDKDLSAAAMESLGSYDQARATYDATTKAQVPEDFRRAQLDLEQAKANLDVSRKVFESRQALFAQGAIPGRDLDTARASLVQSQAAFDIAQQRLDAAKAVSREASLKAAKGQLDAAAGKYRGAEALLSYTQIRSPIGGVVTECPLYAGETAAAGTTLLTVMDTSALLVKLHLPQAQLQQLKPGAAALVHVDGVDEAIHGEVALISPALDSGSTTVEVWVKIANPHASLKPGSPARVSMVASTVPEAIVVPSNAVLADSGGKSAVMVIDAEGVAHRRAVTTGISDGGMTQIVEGLQPGERIVTTGAYAMDDGTRVKIVSATETEPDGDKPAAGKTGDKD